MSFKHTGLHSQSGVILTFLFISAFNWPRFSLCYYVFPRKKPISLFDPPRSATLEVVAFRSSRHFTVAVVVVPDRRLRRRGVNGLHEGRRRVGELGLVGGGKSAVVVVVVVAVVGPSRLVAIFVAPEIYINTSILVSKLPNPSGNTLLPATLYLLCNSKETG